MVRISLFLIVMFINLPGLQAQVEGSADPFAAVDLSKYEEKKAAESNKAEGEGQAPDSADPFGRVKVDELPTVGLEEKARAIQNEISAARKSSNGVEMGEESEDHKAFERVKVTQEKCRGKDISTCLKEDVIKKLEQEKEPVTIAPPAPPVPDEKVVPATEVTSEVDESAKSTSEEISAVQDKKVAEEVAPISETVEVIEVIQIKPAVAGKEENKDIIESQMESQPMPSNNMPESKVDESLLKIQNSIKMGDKEGPASGSPEMRAPAQSQ